VTWRGAGPDRAWTNPANWDRGIVPGPFDAARFDEGSPDAVLDEAASGALGAVILEGGFSATVRLGRDLSITQSLVIAGGTLAQGPHRLSAARLEQTGGRLAGGSAPLQIGAATVSGGMLETPCVNASIRTLEIRAPGLVRVGENGRLELTGDGSPLLGDGLLDTTTNRPTSVEFTGRATMDVPLSEGATPSRPPRFGTDRENPERSRRLAASRKSRTPLAFGDAERILRLDAGENAVFASLVDSAAGFAYFAFPGFPAPSPAEIVKVRISDFTRVGTLTLAQGESDIRSAVIDTAGGFAYFGVYASPGSIVKVRLSDFSRVSSLPLNPGEDYLDAAAIDPAAGFAYFGTFTIPGSIVKVRLSDFTRVGAMTLDPGEDLVVTSMIDPPGGFAYFATGQVVVKIRLSDFSRVGSFLFGSITTSVIEPGGAFAYFGAGPNLGTVVKVRLSDLTEAGRIDCAPTVGGLATSAIDATGQFAYFGINSFSGDVVRVRLSDFTRVDALSLGGTGVSFVSAAVLDPVDGSLFLGASGPSGKIVKVRLSDFSRVGDLAFRSGEDFLLSSAIDTAAGFAYFGAATIPGRVVKIRLSDFTRVGALTLGPGEDKIVSAVVDPVAGFAYFGTYTDPGVVVKVRLSDFTRVSSTALDPGESYLFSASIDTNAGFAYFGTYTAPLPQDSHGLLVKVRLSDLTRVGTLDVTAGPGSVFCSVIDPPGGFAYVGATASFSSAVVKVRLSDFTRADVLTLPDLSVLPSSAVIDTAAGFALFGGYDDPAVVARIRLSDFTRDGTLTLPNGEGFLASAVIDTAAGFAYFGTETAPGRVIKIRLSDVTRAGALALVTQGSVLGLETRFLTSAVIDTAAGFAYFGTNTRLSQVARVDLSTIGAASASVSGGGAFCPGITNTVRAFLSGTPPWSITWSDGVMQTGLLTSPASRSVAPTATITYTVQSVADANGAGNSLGSATFTVLPLPPAPTITAPSAAFPGATGLTASVPHHVGSTYNWSSSSGLNALGLSSNSVTFTAALSGPTQLFVQEVVGSCPSPTASALVEVATATPALRLHTLPPCRVFDTRSSSGLEAASPALAAGADRVFDTTGRCSIPPTATALSVNVTVTGPVSAGSLTLHPGNERVSPTTTISFSPGQTRANNATVRLGSDGSGTIGVWNNSAGTVHFILDVNGYFE